MRAHRLGHQLLHLCVLRAARLRRAGRGIARGRARSREVAREVAGAGARLGALRARALAPHAPHLRLAVALVGHELGLLLLVLGLAVLVLLLLLLLALALRAC